MKNNEVIQRLKKHYVGKDCCQTIFPFGKKATIISPDGIIFHIDDKRITNNYSFDERRKQFPYNNIPIHYQKYIPYFDTYMGYANELIEYNKPYITITGNCVFETVALKDNDTALVISKLLYPSNNEKIADERVVMKDKDILKLIRSKSDEDIYYIYEDGDMAAEIPFEHDSNKTFFVIRIKDNNTTMEGYRFAHIHDNNYYVDKYNIPISKYKLEDMSNYKIHKAIDPEISLKLNPSITKDDIKKAKRMVKSLKRC